MEVTIEKCPTYIDERGSLVQFVTSSFLREYAFPFGQVYLLTFNDVGVVRGNHYHKDSFEVFCLISGSVDMVFEDVISKEKINYSLSTDTKEFYRITIGKMTAHKITSTSNFVIVASFSSSEYNASNEDKIFYPI